MAFTTQVLENGPRNYVIMVTGAATETAATLVDVSAINASTVVLEEIQYDVLTGISVEFLWDATTDSSFFKAHGHADSKCFKHFGGIKNDQASGYTGDVKITVAGTSPSYWFIAHFRKVT